MIELPAHVDPRTLEAALEREGVLVDTRDTTLRLSPGVLTDSSVMDVLTMVLPQS